MWAAPNYPASRAQNDNDRFCDLRHSVGDNKKSLNGEIRKITDILIMEIGMRVVWLLSFSLIVSSANADESLWKKLIQDPNMIVIMRNSESSGNRDGINMLEWDATGK